MIAGTEQIRKTLAHCAVREMASPSHERTVPDTEGKTGTSVTSAADTARNADQVDLDKNRLLPRNAESRFLSKMNPRK